MFACVTVNLGWLEGEYTFWLTYSCKTHATRYVTLVDVTSGVRRIQKCICPSQSTCRCTVVDVG